MLGEHCLWIESGPDCDWSEINRKNHIQRIWFFRYRYVSACRIIISLSSDKLQICRTVQPIYSCNANIFLPFVSSHLCRPLGILSNVKQTVLILSLQYNTAPRSTRYTSRTPFPLPSLRYSTCLYICCRQNINSSQFVLEVTHFCTVLQLIYCDFIILCQSALCNLVF